MYQCTTCCLFGILFIVLFFCIMSTTQPGMAKVISDSAFSQSPNSTRSMELQQTRVSPSRLAEEVVVLLECTNITSDDSKKIQQEIQDSPFESTISDILTELFKERESLPCNMVETARDSTRVADTILKLDDKLERENIICAGEEDTDFAHLDDKDISLSTLHEYRNKISQIKQVYDSQQRTLKSLCDECEKGVMTFFRDQPQCIPIDQEKIHSIVQSFRERCQYIHLELKTNVAETVDSVQKVMLEKSTKRRKRNFSKQASEILNEYFYSHLDNPYPCEEVKSELAAMCKITIGQVNNWFGNKRIRYKRNIGKDNNMDINNKAFHRSDLGDNATGINEESLSSSGEELDYMEMNSPHGAQLN